MTPSRKVKVKICGITNLADALTAIREGADWLGFVFYKKSPRYISPDKAKAIIVKLPPAISKVGVFVNEKPATVKRIAGFCGLDVLQFHGGESPGYCRKFPGYKIIKAFRIKDSASLKEIEGYQVDGYLMDAFSDKGYGGMGKIFRWTILKKLPRKIFPLILSGGLNPGNVAAAIRKVRPFAVDLSSGVESRPGKKSLLLLKKFFTAVKRSAA